MKVTHKGIIKSVDPQLGVKVYVPGLPTVTIPIDVIEKGDLANLKAGDNIILCIKVEADVYWLQEPKAQAAPIEASRADHGDRGGPA